MNTPQREHLARVVVIGTSCCGKTTFARQLAALLDQAHVELDALYWGPHWTPREPAEFEASVTRTVESERWVIDGNYSIVQNLIWPRATAIVWLNYPFPLVLARALGRTLGRVARREELFSGNRETLRAALFSRDSILWWVISSHRRRRRRYRRLLGPERPSGLSVYELRNPREAEAFLSRVARQARPAGAGPPTEPPAWEPGRPGRSPSASPRR